MLARFFLVLVRAGLYPLGMDLCGLVLSSWLVLCFTAVLSTRLVLLVRVAFCVAFCLQERTRRICTWYEFDAAFKV